VGCRVLHECHIRQFRVQPAHGVIFSLKELHPRGERELQTAISLATVVFYKNGIYPVCLLEVLFPISSVRIEEGGGISTESCIQAGSASYPSESGCHEGPSNWIVRSGTELSVTLCRSIKALARCIPSHHIVRNRSEDISETVIDGNRCRVQNAGTAGNQLKTADAVHEVPQAVLPGAPPVISPIRRVPWQFEKKEVIRKPLQNVGQVSCLSPFPIFHSLKIFKATKACRIASEPIRAC
jgi:hypothetical protein